jgi:hypothetical protein
MRTRSIQPGDIVYANKKGRLFHAKVLGTGNGGVLIVEPIERNISYRRRRSICRCAHKHRRDAKSTAARLITAAPRA